MSACVCEGGRRTFSTLWATVCKTVRPTLSDRCLSVLSVCNVGVLWPNGWTDQDIKLGMQVGLGPGHTVIDGDPAPLPTGGRSPQFSAHICCSQMAGWIKMLLGIEVGLVPGDFVLDGNPATLSGHIFGTKACIDNWKKLVKQHYLLHMS